MREPTFRLCIGWYHAEVQTYEPRHVSARFSDSSRRFFVHSIFAVDTNTDIHLQENNYQLNRMQIGRRTAMCDPTFGFALSDIMRKPRHVWLSLTENLR